MRVESQSGIAFFPVLGHDGYIDFYALSAVAEEYFRSDLRKAHE